MLGLSKLQVLIRLSFSCKMAAMKKPACADQSGNAVPRAQAIKTASKKATTKAANPCVARAPTTIIAPQQQKAHLQRDPRPCQSCSKQESWRAKLKIRRMRKAEDVTMFRCICWSPPESTFEASGVGLGIPTFPQSPLVRFSHRNFHQTNEIGIAPCYACGDAVAPLVACVGLLAAFACCRFGGIDCHVRRKSLVLVPVLAAFAKHMFCLIASPASCADVFLKFSTRRGML